MHCKYVSRLLKIYSDTMENRTRLEDGLGGKGDGTQDSPNREENRNSKVIVYSCKYASFEGLILVFPLVHI